MKRKYVFISHLTGTYNKKKSATELQDWNEKTQQGNVDTLAIYFLNIRKMGLPQGK